MKPPYVYAIGALVIAAWLLPAPAPGMSRPDQTSPEGPQTEQARVREGSFAVKLASALRLLSTDNEAEAMRELNWFRIAPRGGWIADQPVTPGTLRGLRRDVAQAAEDDRFLMNTEEALRQLDQVAASLGLSFDSTPEADADRYATDNQPDQPVERYYYPYPPSAYYDLYPWYPYPFAWGHWYFPGFFFMYDYHYSPHRHHYPHRRPHRTMERRGHR